MNKQKFWVCLVDDRSNGVRWLGTKRHYNEREAKQEAEQLAEQTGHEVFLLEASHFVRFVPPKPPKSEVIWTATSGII